MISLTRTAHGPASGLRQGRSRACDAYQRRIAAARPSSMTPPIVAQLLAPTRQADQPPVSGQLPPSAGPGQLPPSAGPGQLPPSAGPGQLPPSAGPGQLPSSAGPGQLPPSAAAIASRTEVTSRTEVSSRTEVVSRTLVSARTAVARPSGASGAPRSDAHPAGTMARRNPSRCASAIL